MLWLSTKGVHPEMRIVLNMLRALLFVVAAGPAHAYVWFTPEALLTSFFPDGSTVSVEWTPSADQAAAFKATVGYPLPSKRYTWHTAAAPSTSVAIVDDQIGQHEPITFAVRLSADCKVERVEIMVYREAYGEGVRAARFRGQFTGKKAVDPMRAGREIQIVSGATVSSRSLAIGVRRAAALCEVWRAG